MRAYERFLNYAKLNTQASESTGTTPSTESQLVLANLLVSELCAIGIDAAVDPHGYVYAAIPATAGCENAPALGFVAHMDTAPAFSGEGVTPILHEHYDGGDLILPKENRVIRVSDFPALEDMTGKTVITADGSTLLGADDKAGIAEIITACAELLEQGTPHGAIKLAFTPDEEIGEGADHFDVERLGADFAYTLDGDAVGGIEYENFNAAAAKICITGVSVHPGSAKGIMENALLIACEMVAALPANETPAHTEGYEGFFHVDEIHGDAAQASLSLIVRDHSSEKFEARKALLQAAVATVQQAHPSAQLTLELSDNYYNMAQQIAPCMHLVENAKKATIAAGAVPHIKPIRGGTDGAHLSYMGLPCPNLGTGGQNFHGPMECIAAEDMDVAVQIIKNIIALYAQG